MIKGLLEQRGRLPRLGVIRLGITVEAETRDGKKYQQPKNVDYFVIPDELAAALGERQPKTLAVLLPTDDPFLNLPHEYERYDGKVKALACDRETARAFKANPKLGVRDGEVFACRRPPGIAQKCACEAKAKGRLNVIIPQYPHVGVWQVLVGGEQPIADLLSEQILYGGRTMLGRLTGVIFRLVREEATVQAPMEDGTRKALITWPVHLRCDITAAHGMALGGGRPVLAIAGPVAERMAEVFDDDFVDPTDAAEPVERVASDPKTTARAMMAEMDEAAKGPSVPAGQASGPNAAPKSTAAAQSKAPASRPAPAPAAAPASHGSVNPGDPWDASMLLKTAVERFGLAQAEYMNYFAGVYKANLRAATPGQIAKQREVMEEALASEIKTKTHAQAMKALAAKVAAGKVPGAPQAGA